jgi:hypothetical protein
MKFPKSPLTFRRNISKAACCLLVRVLLRVLLFDREDGCYLTKRRLVPKQLFLMICVYEY